MNGTGNESKPTVHWTRYAVGVLATLAGLLLVWYFRDIVGYIIVSAVLAIIGTPLAKLMKRVRSRCYRRKRGEKKNLYWHTNHILPSRN